MKKFPTDSTALRRQFENIAWIKESGPDESALTKRYDELMARSESESHALLKAELFALLCEKSRLAVDREDIFQDKLFASNFMSRQRSAWTSDVRSADAEIARMLEEKKIAHECGAYRASEDFGHTSPNSKLLLEVGFVGLLSRVEEAEKAPDLSEKQKEFYLSCKMVLDACMTFLSRMAEAIAPYNAENANALRHLSVGAPRDIYEAMQLLIAYFFLHEYVYKTRVRTLGRLDVLLEPFYSRDVESGRYTKADVHEMLKFFLNKFSAANVPFGLPFCLGGMDEDGRDVTSEISYMIVEAYGELDIFSPKIHIRVSPQTPDDFLKLILRSIRSGQSSYVFCNDGIGVRTLMGVGISERDARNYTPIGCYEPAVWGKEIGCTGNAGVSLIKALEFVLTGGRDEQSGRQITRATEEKLDTFDSFCLAVKDQIAQMNQKCMDYVRRIEAHYHVMGPDPLLSSMYDESVRRGVDVYEGGALYNNSSVYFYFIATLVDSLTAIKKFVYDEKRLTLEELYGILKNDWQGQEKLRLQALRMPEKYGNGNATADALTRDFADYCASICNGQPNGRGGVFKAACFSIDWYVEGGKKTMATPDGRHAGDVVSKNLCATVSMDKNGILALISSVTKIDHAKFPNGSVLDLMLHPSAVSGEDGLDAFLGVLKTYMAKGGFAMHANVFNVDDLRAAQENPEKYKTLQVRVCGWNAYFVTLRKEEQDAFIRQAEALA